MANQNDERQNLTADDNRGFNTIRNSAIEKRQKNQAMQKYTFLGVVVLFAFMLVMLVVLAVSGIIANLTGNNDNPFKEPAGENIQWTSQTVSVSDTQQGPLVLVNSTHAYVFPTNNEHLKEIYAAFVGHDPHTYQQSGLSTYMETTALTALDAMLTDFCTATGKDNVQIRSAYRDQATQEQFSTPVGHSDHHTGFGCELKYTKEGAAYHFSADPENGYAWINENAAKYGFIIRYPADKVDVTGVSDYDSYYRYVGPAHATYMAANNLCMEEYIEVLKGYSQSKPLEIRGADGIAYEVYYTAVSGSATIKLPTNYAYTLSGTNEGGVVVTINRSEVITPETESDTTADTPAA